MRALLAIVWLTVCVTTLRADAVDDTRVPVEARERWWRDADNAAATTTTTDTARTAVDKGCSAMQADRVVDDMEREGVMGAEANAELERILLDEASATHDDNDDVDNAADADDAAARAAWQARRPNCRMPDYDDDGDYDLDNDNDAANDAAEDCGDDETAVDDYDDDGDVDVGGGIADEVDASDNGGNEPADDAHVESRGVLPDDGGDDGDSDDDTIGNDVNAESPVHGSDDTRDDGDDAHGGDNADAARAKRLASMERAMEAQRAADAAVEAEAAEKAVADKAAAEAAAEAKVAAEVVAAEQAAADKVVAADKVAAEQAMADKAAADKVAAEKAAAERVAADKAAAKHSAAVEKARKDSACRDTKVTCLNGGHRRDESPCAACECAGAFSGDDCAICGLRCGAGRVDTAYRLFSVLVADAACAHCVCPRGYVGSPADGCVDVDECKFTIEGRRLLGSRCDHRVECVNVVGGFECGACPEGHTGDGTRCFDIAFTALAAAVFVVQCALLLNCFYRDNCLSRRRHGNKEMIIVSGASTKA
jgi:hypothetical protein